MKEQIYAFIEKVKTNKIYMGAALIGAAVVGYFLYKKFKASRNGKKVSKSFR